MINSLILLANRSAVMPYIVSEAKTTGYIISVDKETIDNCKYTYIDCYKEKYIYKGTLDFHNNFDVKLSYLTRYSSGDKVDFIVRYYSNGDAEYYLDSEQSSRSETQNNKSQILNRIKKNNLIN